MNHHSRPAIGTSDARIVPPTMPIGRSRSVSSSASPPARAADAAMAERMPATIGPMILSRVQTAATPIVPAPMKRTWLRKTLFTVAATSAPTPCIEVSTGTNTAHEISMPISMAMPTVMPTRWPTPIKAKDRLAEAPLAAPPPRRKAVASSPATSFIAASNAKPAEAIEPATMAARPLAFSSAPPIEPEPTLSTSAAATPSG